MFGKVFQQMYDGTLGTAGPWEAIVTFQQMIVLADKNGEVDLTIPALARRTTIPLPIIEKGIDALMKPDPYSRTPGEDGRRIVPLDDHRPWGWRIVNYLKYRDIKSEDERRQYHRSYYHTVRKLKNVENVESQQNSTLSNHTDTDTEVEAKAEEKKEKRERSPAGSRLPADWVCPSEWLDYCRSKRPDLDANEVACSFADFWKAKAGAAARKVDWQATWRTWVRNESVRPSRGRSAPSESFRERDDRLAAERVYEMTGGNLGRAPAAKTNQPTQEIFDVTPRRLDR